MPFTEGTRKKVLEQAHYSCCVCQKASITIEVHHIVPEADGGADTEDNAAPLCPSCHADYGGNPAKRKAIRERRDFWYEHCSRREQPKIHWVQMADRLSETATKEDLKRMEEAIVSEMSAIINQPNKPLHQIRSELGSFVATATSGATYLTISCPRCHSPFAMPSPLAHSAKCPSCGYEVPDSL